MKIPLTLFAVFISAFLVGNSTAQSGTTSVSGTVFDRRGQIIFGATVTLTDAEKGFARTAMTDDNGAFNFPVIQPGIYRLEVEMNGFKKFLQNEVRASVDTPTDVSAILEVGNINETVTVQSDSAPSCRRDLGDEMGWAK